MALIPWIPEVQTDKQTNRQTDRQTERKTDRQKDRQTVRQIDRREYRRLFLGQSRVSYADEAMTVPRWIIEISNHFKTQEMCIEAVRIKQFSLAYVPGQLKTQEMCSQAAHNELCMMLFVPDCFKNRGDVQRDTAYYVERIAPCS